MNEHAKECGAIDQDNVRSKYRTLVLYLIGVFESYLSARISTVRANDFFAIYYFSAFDNQIGREGLLFRS